MYKIKKSLPNESNLKSSKKKYVSYFDYLKQSGGVRVGGSKKEGIDLYHQISKEYNDVVRIDLDVKEFVINKVT